MDTPFSRAIGYCLEGALALAGIVILVRWVRLYRRAAPPKVLPRWPLSGLDLALFILAAAFSWVLGNFAGDLTARFLKITDLDHAIFVVIVVSEPIAILGVLAFSLFYRGIGIARPSRPAAAQALKRGFGLYLAAVPVVLLATFLWQGGLDLAGYNVTNQDTVKLFMSLRGVGAPLLFGIYAVIMAPIFEEILFRAAIFRGLRNFIPRGYALAISAVCFGLAHHDLSSLVPLIVLGLMLAYAYELTGNIGVPMVAHALFNLTSLVGLLLGINT